MHLSEEAVSISKITLEQLVDRYQDLVFTLCYRMVGNYCEAQDLTQETFLAAWRALERFDGQYEKAWLCRIAANKCTDFLRRRQLQLVPDGEEAMLTVPDAAPDPERRVVESDVLDQLRAACLRSSSALSSSGWASSSSPAKSRSWTRRRPRTRAQT